MAGFIDEVMDGIKDGKPEESAPVPAVPSPAAETAAVPAPADIQYSDAFRHKYGERKK
jgi:hypothetical protein